jgi:hypothetical protein
VVSPDSQLTINGDPCLYDANTSPVTEALGYFIRRIVKYRSGPLTIKCDYEVEIAWDQ